ncbi:nitroreductase family protein [Macrococcus armenti]|uniref:nitroreductase family protein n=1 Tax=Macrococcus armenti TaxID=2875764 RepID=UPI001CCFBD03|nr:nitroreductase family protein [Macrococcus armenti]UBH08529.1 nitroreductase family protein [Macrococcus armenti]UBH10814.1 nitroreductase family protein [Macrococcus armenti]UBH15295.1 nitroreductase family protein [Macrococcus armenti]UBH17653.1 nitroreductase family protein [Macrococcus armenti]UBH19920.1 nitroreductase family protein [Macrococcus armenti]
MKDISLKQAIESRHSIKEFDPNISIPHETMEEMIKLATKAPSSLNLQPWRFVVVDSDEAKAVIRDHVHFNTRQLDTSSAFVLVLSDNEHIHDLDRIMQQNVKEGYMNQIVKVENTKLMQSLIDQTPKELMYAQGMMDSAMAAMQFMLVAKDYGYDTNPIGGFDRAAVLEALNIDAERYAPIMFIAIGVAAKEHYPSSRYDIAEVMSYNMLETATIGTKKPTL